MHEASSPIAPEALTPQERQFQVEQFLYREADLLDWRRFDEWLDVVDEDVTYWMPISHNVRRGREDDEFTRHGVDINWFDEGKETLAKRIGQIKTGQHWAEEPASRSSHLVTNIRIVDVSDDGSEAVVSCRFMVYQNRLADEVNQLVGKRRDTLRWTPEGMRLLRREIYLDQTVLLAKALTVLL